MRGAARLGLAGWPRAAEESIVARDALLARDALRADDYGGLSFGPNAKPILKGEESVEIVGVETYRG